MPAVGAVLNETERDDDVKVAVAVLDPLVLATLIAPAEIEVAPL